MEHPIRWKCINCGDVMFPAKTAKAEMYTCGRKVWLLLTCPVCKEAFSHVLGRWAQKELRYLEPIEITPPKVETK